MQTHPATCNAGMIMDFPYDHSVVGLDEHPRTTSLVQTYGGIGISLEAVNVLTWDCVVHVQTNCYDLFQREKAEFESRVRIHVHEIYDATAVNKFVAVERDRPTQGFRRGHIVIASHPATAAGNLWHNLTGVSTTPNWKMVPAPNYDELSKREWEVHIRNIVMRSGSVSQCQMQASPDGHWDWMSVCVGLDEQSLQSELHPDTRELSKALVKLACGLNFKTLIPLGEYLPHPVVVWRENRPDVIPDHIRNASRDLIRGFRADQLILDEMSSDISIAARAYDGSLFELG